MPKVKYSPRRRRERKGKLKTVTGDKPPDKSSGRGSKKAKRSIRTPVGGVLGTEIEQNSKRRLSSSSSDAGLNGGRPAVRERKKSSISGQPDLSSGESTAEGREGKKRKRGASSESGEEEGGERERRRERQGAKEVRVSETSQTKWKPVSQAARKLLSDGMLSALGHSLDGLRGPQRRAAEKTIQQVMQRVEQDVAAVKAPPGKRMTSCADLKHRVAELKDKCIHLVDRNQEMTQRLEERKLFCEERRVNTQQLEAVAQSHTTHTLHQLPEPPPSDSDEESFAGYIRDLISQPPTTHRDLPELDHTIHDT